MLFARLLLSPYAHAKIRSIDTSDALAMPGVKAILLPEDVPGPKDQVNDMGQTLRANPYTERALASEPLYQGEPVLAVCAVDEAKAATRSRKSRQVDVLPQTWIGPLCDQASPRRGRKATGGRPPRKHVAPPCLEQGSEVDRRQFAESAKDAAVGEGVTDPTWSFGDGERDSRKRRGCSTKRSSHLKSSISVRSRSCFAFWQNAS